MAREGLRYELTNAFQKALRQKDAVALKGLKIGTNGGEHFVDITVQRLEEPEPLRGLVMIVFTDVRRAAGNAKRPGRSRKAPGRSARLAELEQELPAGLHGVADHPRRDADLAGRTPLHQRGNAVHQ